MTSNIGETQGMGMDDREAIDYYRDESTKHLPDPATVVSVRA